MADLIEDYNIIERQGEEKQFINYHSTDSIDTETSLLWIEPVMWSVIGCVFIVICLTLKSIFKSKHR